MKILCAIAFAGTLATITQSMFCVATGAEADAPENPDSARIEQLIARKLNAELLALQKRQTALYAALQEKLPESERARRLNEHATRYELLLEDFPNAPLLLVLYGKFLRDIGEDARARELFEKAEKLAPELAVVHQQIGAIAAETGDAKNAFSRLERALALEPTSARYHYQFAEFIGLFQKKLIEQKCFENRASAETRMQDAFRAAIALEPDNLDYRWRYAESFYDLETPKWVQAIAAWDSTRNQAVQTDFGTNPAGKEKILEAIDLHRARVFAELGNFAQAEKLLAAGTSPQLEKTRRHVRRIIFQKKQLLPKNLK